MTTTLHPIIREAERVITDASKLLEGEGFSRKAGHAFGLPEAVAEAAGSDALARVVAERALVRKGLDVWWNDLIVQDGDELAAAMRAVLPIDERMYGPASEAVLGLLFAASGLSTEQLHGIGNLTHSLHYALFNRCLLLSEAVGEAALLAQVCSDVAFATAHYATTPAGVAHRLKSVRGLECTAAALILKPYLSSGEAMTLTYPVAAILYPHVVGVV